MGTAVEPELLQFGFYFTLETGAPESSTVVAQRAAWRSLVSSPARCYFQDLGQVMEVKVRVRFVSVGIASEYKYKDRYCLWVAV